jgi:hypothetical protein
LNKHGETRFSRTLFDNLKTDSKAGRIQPELRLRRALAATPVSRGRSEANYSPPMFHRKALLLNGLRPEMPNYSPVYQVSGLNGDLFSRCRHGGDDASSSGSMTSAIIQDLERAELFTTEPAGPVNNSLPVALGVETQARLRPVAKLQENLGRRGSPPPA